MLRRQSWQNVLATQRFSSLLDVQSREMLAKQLLSLVLVTLCSFTAHVLAQDSVLGPPSTDPACADPPAGQCAFYADCLEPRYQCGPDGYPIGYGQHYCQKFSDDSGMFDARGQQWMFGTMHCLQLALVGDAIDATPPASDCQALSDQAFASHPGCYIDNGFCTLDVEDWAAVLEIVGVDGLLSSSDFKQAITTTAGCEEFYAYMVERGLY